MSETELREALRDAAVWFEAEAAHPRPIPGPAMAAQAARIREVLAASIPAEPEQADEGLDVERLAKALHEDDDGSLGTVEAYRAEAVRLAAEYSRLAPARDDTR